MAHIDFTRVGHGPAVADAWLAATAAATQYVGRVSGREELAVKLGPGFAAAAGTAMFSPATLEIEVDTNVMLPGVKPEDVLPFDDLFQARHPLFMGAMIHEASHARYSRWVPMNLMFEGTPFNKRKVDVLTALEESRIEKRMLKRMLKRMPKMRGMLAAIVFDLLGKDFKVSDDAYGASITAALILARVDAGSITLSDAKPFRAIINDTLDDATLDVLRGLWNEYHALRFPVDEPLPLESMDSIATRWIEALGMDASDEGGEMVCVFIPPMPGMGGGEGEGEGGDAPSGGGGDAENGSDGQGGAGDGGGLSERVREAAADAKHDKEMDAAEKVGDIKKARRAAQRAADMDRHAKGKKAAEAAFGKPGERKETGRGNKHHGYTATGGSSVSWRKPTDRERAAGVRLSNLLEKVIYTDRRVAKVRQVEPAGRMHGRGQVQRAAQRAAGQRAVAAGWTAKRRTHVDEPMMRVGVMLDVSGSMNAQARVAGSLAYAVGNAVERVGGDFAMTLFGSDVLGLVKSGEKLDVAPQVSPGCGWEYFSKAFFALDNELDLIDGDGLRVLILLSDGVFVQDAERKLADAIFPMLVSKGVVLMHVDIGDELKDMRYSGYNPMHNNPLPPVVIPNRADPVDASAKIGEHLINLVKKFKGTGAAA